MPDRRTFLISLSGVVAAPVFAQLSLPATATRDVPWIAGDAPGSIAPLAAPSPAKVALRIDGWEPAGSEADMWIRVNSSWRTAWR
jgi:hypothetical protein